MTILSESQIFEEFAKGTIRIRPFRATQINPSSYDVTLGSSVAVYKQRSWLRRLVLFLYYLLFFRIVTRFHLDSKKPNEVDRFDIPADGIVLRPGVLYLMHTREIIHTNRFVGVVDGKSSIGRLGVVVHLTAGYIDPGFDGQVTLEVTCIHPVRVYAGMRIAQVRFESLLGQVSLYDGHYKGPTAIGAIASHSWEQFE